MSDRSSAPATQPTGAAAEGGSLGTPSVAPLQPRGRGQGQGRGRRGRRRWAALGVAVVALASIPLAGRADNGDTTPGVRLAGTIPRLPGCGQTAYAVDPGLGVFIAVYTEGSQVVGCSGSTPTRTLAAVYSTATLQRLNQVVLHAPSQPPTFLAPIVDTQRHRLFLVGLVISGDPTPIYRYDLRRILTSRTPLDPSATFPNSLPTKPSPADASSDQDQTGTIVDSGLNIQVLNAAYDAASDSLDVTMFNPDSVGSSNAPGTSEDEYLADVDGTSGAQRFFTRLGQCVIPQQNSTIHSKDPILHTRTAIAVGCGYHSNLSVIDPSGASGAGEVLTTVLPLGSDGKPSGRPSAYLGKTGALGGVADPATGRIFFVVAPPTNANAGAAAQGPSAVTFDVAHTAYIGAATVNSAAAVLGGFIVAVGGGRVYAVGPGGVFVADATSTPVDPGLIYPAYSCKALDAYVDSSSHRILVVPDSGCKAYGGRLAVLEDDSVILPTSDSDPDLNTHDIDEKPGTTQTTFAGRSSGTALRMRFVGGITTLENGLTLDTYDEFFGPDQPLVPPAGFSLVARVPNSRPVIGRDFSNREIDLAHVSATDLDNVQANAAAIAGLVDDTSASDVNEATTVNNPPARVTKPSPGATPAPALVAGQSVPFQQAACSAPKHSAQTTSYQPAPGTTSDVAKVSCTLGAQVTASTVVNALGVDLGTGTPIFSILGGDVQTTVERDAQQGTVASVTSTVHGLAIGPLLIDTVKTTTSCRAHGRHGTASCTFQRLIGGVYDAGTAVFPASCTETDSGSTGSAGCQQLIAQLNGILPGKLIFAAPAPDQRRGYVGGSPGGYQAVVQRDLYEHLQDSLLNNDERLTVPGLDILYVNDTASAPSRVELQVAGGQAEAHYGINPPFSFLDNSGISVSLPGGGSVNVPLPPSSLPPAPPSLGGTTPTGAVTPPAPTGGLPRLLSRIWDGLQLLGRSPGTALLVAMLLGLLSLPLLVSWRRGRLLAELGRVRA